MAQRTHYWSCSKFADWLRGTAKPGAQTGDGWRKWHKMARASHKIRYWLAEEGLDMIQNTLWYLVDKLYDLKYYINNRWVTRTHSLTAHHRDIKPGTWCDVGNRFLPCLFNELVDFVEVETAWSNIAWSKESRKEYNAPYYAWGWFRWRTWRSAEAGIEHLNWAKNLDNSDWLSEDEKHKAEPTGQALAAREILELYDWWKNIYPTRKDPHELSGWSDLCNRRRQKLKEEDGEDYRWSSLLVGEEKTEEEKEEVRRILDRCREIEKEYEDENERMMIRLIKIRNHLWT